MTQQTAPCIIWDKQFSSQDFRPKDVDEYDFRPCFFSSFFTQQIDSQDLKCKTQKSPRAWQYRTSQDSYSTHKLLPHCNALLNKVLLILLVLAVKVKTAKNQTSLCCNKAFVMNKLTVLMAENKKLEVLFRVFPSSNMPFVWTSKIQILFDDTNEVLLNIRKY